MSNDKNHSATFERYLKGEMTPEEAHAFERASLDDAFTQEALEGYEAHGTDHFKDIENLRERIDGKSKKGVVWWQYAGVAALVLISFYFLFLTLNQFDEDPQLASEDVPTAKEMAEPLSSDSISNQNNTLVKKVDKDGLSEENEEEVPKELAENFVADQDEVDTFFETKNDAEGISPETSDETAWVAEVHQPENPPESEIRLLESKTEINANTFADNLSEDLTVEEEIAPAAVARSLQGSVAGVQVSSSDSGNNKTFTSIRGSGSLKKSKKTDRLTISGRVTDETGEPLPGVSVVIKGTTTGTQTTLEGSYQIATEDNPTLVFAYVGLESQEIEVNDRDQVDVVMGGSTALQDVVVTGYGISSDLNESYSPAFPKGGKKDYKKYLEENLRYPPSARENEIEGTVILQLTISPLGSIDKIDIRKSVGYGCDEEAIRLVKEGPTWNPASRSGSKIEDKVRIRVKFKL